MKIKLPQKRRLYKRFFNRLFSDGLDNNEFIEAVIVLTIAVAQRDGFMDIHEVNELKNIFIELCPNIDSEEIINNAPKISKKEIVNACDLLNKYANYEQKLDLIRHLYDIATANADRHDEENILVRDIAKHLSIVETEVLELEQLAEDKVAKRSKVINSLAGIGIAIVVIILFIGCAIYLTPLLFGLLLAILFLPVERGLEHALEHNRYVKLFLSIIAVTFSPFRHGAKYITERLHLNKNKRQLSAEEKAEKKKNKLIARATMATVGFSVFLLIGLVAIFGSITVSYMHGFSSEMAKVESENSYKIKKTAAVENIANDNYDDKKDKKTELTNDVEKSSKAFFSVINRKLEGYKEQFIKYPAIKYLITETKTFINNRENQIQILKKIMPKATGVVNVLISILSAVALCLFNILMTIFFFSLILNKLALASSHKQVSTTSYVVNSMLNSGWLPQTSIAVKESVIEIMDNIAYKLRTWVKSYFVIIFIESILYITIFWIIGVPYAPIIGLIAGFTILLPYIGPLSSGILTMLVCLAAGGKVADVNTLLLVLATYIIMNGIIEQLILYPTLVGNALGLTTLETIVVVLLGGYFAGLSGMIFAVPFASVLKYLIPKVYLAINHASVEHSLKRD